MVGKTVSVPTGADAWTFNALLTSQDIDPRAVNTIPRTAFGIDPLTGGKVDAMFAWLVNEGVTLREEGGYEANLIVLSDYGIDTYVNVLFTTEKMIAEQPELVEDFLHAFILGLQDLINNPNKMVELVLFYDDTLDLAGERRRLQASLPLINPANSRLGQMTPEIWQATQQVLLNQGILDEPIDLEAAYTTTFLDKIYKE